MRIANIMLGKGLGGIEQAFLDYGEGLREQGHTVTMISHPEAKINERLSGAGLDSRTLDCRGKWDVRAARMLWPVLNETGADLVVAHGGRAVRMAARAAGGAMPIVGVAHNYRFRELEKADFVLAITPDVREKLIESGKMPGERIRIAENSVRVPKGFIRPVWKQPPVIGTLGRFVAKKGFDVFLQALAELKRRGYDFRAEIGGTGEEEKALKRLRSKLGLEERVLFDGWLPDPAAFLRRIDLFCLPSLHEPFGIVLLEAMAAKLPIVSTDSEGPSQILVPGHDALMVPAGNSVALADALAQMLSNEDAARTLASEAWRSVKRFDRPAAMARLSASLEAIRSDWRGGTVEALSAHPI